MSGSICPQCGTPRAGEDLCATCLLGTGGGLGVESMAERVFCAALGYEEQEREGFVRGAVAGDAGLREEVMQLLEGYAEAGGDLAEATLGGGGNARGLWAALRREEPGTVIDHFRLVRRVGEGGMGAVWEAEQVAPIRRRVALKIIKLGMDTEEVVRRFERERRTLALMGHPHIAQVFEAGTTPQGRPYFAMEMVQGDSIIRYCTEGNVALRERLALFLDVCGAVEHAHQKGVIHRDLKPSNILIAEGRVKVIDFGIAKATLEDGDGLRTQLAQVLGTPAYMSPEQAESAGQDVDTRTDVWSLGVVLYELLTGVLPFSPDRLTGHGEMSRILGAESPPRPSLRVVAGRKELKGDLDWIVMKALSKERARRYASAAAFAEDVGRYLEGRAVSAAPPSGWYHAGKFVRRNLAAVVSAVVVLLALAGGLLVSMAQVRETRRALAGEAQARREATFVVADLYARSGVAAAEKGDPSRASLWFTHAARIAVDDPERVAANRLRAATWGATASVPVVAFETGLSHIERIDYHPGGRAVILTQADRKGAQVWDLQTSAIALHTPAALDASAWDATGTKLAISVGSRVHVLEYPSGRELAVLDAGPRAEVAFSPDGETLAVGASPPFLWAWKSGTVHPAAEIPGGVKRFRWSAAGDLLLQQGMEQVGVLRVSDPGKWLFEPVPDLSSAASGFVGESGKICHTPPASGRSLIRDGVTGEILAEIPGDEGLLAASADGRMLASAHHPMWDVQRGAERASPRRLYDNLMPAACFSPDSQWLATGSHDGTARLWSVAEDREIGLIGWHQAPVQSVAFSPDGDFLASAQSGLVRVWRLREAPLSKGIPMSGPSLAALSADGKWLAASGITNCFTSLRRTRVYQVDSGEPAGPEMDVGGSITDAAFSPDGTWLAILCATDPDRGKLPWTRQPGSGFLEIWDWRAGVRIGARVAMPSEPRGLAVHPSGGAVAVYCGLGEAVEWDRKSGVLRSLFPGNTLSQPQQTLNNGRCAWTPDGRYLLAWGEPNAWRIWDRQSGREIPLPQLWRGMVVHGLALHGGVVALAPLWTSSPVVRVFDISSGKEIAAGLSHSDWLYAADFDETGRYLLTTGRRPAQVWDWREGRVIGPALPHGTEVMAGHFMPGTPWVVTGAHDGLVRFWDPHSGLQMRPAISCPGRILQLEITPDRKHLIAAGDLEGGIQIIDLSRAMPAAGVARVTDVELLTAEVNAAAVVHPGGGLVPLTAEAWLEKWQVLKSLQQAEPGPAAGSGETK